MKVLLVNSFDAKGGASIAAMRLHQSLNKENIENQFLVQFKLSDNPEVLSETNFFIIFLNKVLSKLDALIGRVLLKDINNYSSAFFSSINMVNKINKLNPDIVHLHWTCNGMLSIEDIPKIQAPILWTMHDNWVFSDGCHNMSLCKNHQEETNKCSKYINYIHKRKMKAFDKKADIYFLSLSSWLHDLALKSTLIGNRKNYHLPNPIDTKVYSPIQQSIARKNFNLQIDKKIILFGALNASSDKNKGLHLLFDVISKFKDDEIEVVVFGDNKPLAYQNFKFHNFGKIDNEQTLNLLLNAGNALVIPSLQENFSNLILEGLSASIPVVAFDVGGNKDLILHKENGYLAKPFNADDLKRGIDWILGHESSRALKEHARNSVLLRFDSKKVAKDYIQLYESIIKN
jgi:glycosyltransferase involved in cell wall biosynthesis